MCTEVMHCHVPDAVSSQAAGMVASLLRWGSTLLGYAFAH